MSHQTQKNLGALLVGIGSGLAKRKAEDRIDTRKAVLEAGFAMAQAGTDPMLDPDFGKLLKGMAPELTTALPTIARQARQAAQEAATAKKRGVYETKAAELQAERESTAAIMQELGGAGPGGRQAIPPTADMGAITDPVVEGYLYPRYQTSTVSGGKATLSLREPTKEELGAGRLRQARLLFEQATSGNPDALLDRPGAVVSGIIEQMSAIPEFRMDAAAAQEIRSDLKKEILRQLMVPPLKMSADQALASAAYLSGDVEGFAEDELKFARDLELARQKADIEKETAVGQAKELDRWHFLSSSDPATIALRAQTGNRFPADMSPEELLRATGQVEEARHIEGLRRKSEEVYQLGRTRAGLALEVKDAELRANTYVLVGEGGLFDQLQSLSRKINTVSDKDPFFEARLAMHRVGSVIGRKVGGEDLSMYYSVARSFAGQLAKLYGGEDGRLTEGDIERALAVIPNELDSTEVATAKLDLMKRAVDLMHAGNMEGARRLLDSDARVTRWKAKVMANIGGYREAAAATIVPGLSPEQAKAPFIANDDITRAVTLPRLGPTSAIPPAGDPELDALLGGEGE